MASIDFCVCAARPALPLIFEQLRFRRINRGLESDLFWMAVEVNWQECG